jgi:DNA-binding NtrC family response regulator
MGVQHIRLFHNGSDCMDLLKDGRPDIVFIDYQMDLADDFDLLKKIKLFDPNIYVVMLSAQEHIKLSDAVHRHGAFDTVQKGDKEPQKVKELLQRILDIREMLDQPANKFIKKFLKMF